MRIYIFYQDAFEPGGAPVGVRQLAMALGTRYEVCLVGRQGRHRSPVGSVRTRAYRSLLGLIQNLPRWLRADRPDMLILVGFFLAPNALVARITRRLGIDVILHPIAQVDAATFSGKVFTHGCDVRELERRRINHLTPSKRLLDRISPLTKSAYVRSAGTMINRCSDYIAVLSPYERDRYQEEYPRPDRIFLQLPWGIDPIDTATDSPHHFYHRRYGAARSTRNFIVWSRLDWHYKGLDRLLHGVRHLRDRIGADAVPFRLHLCGPDYRAGSVLASRYIADHDLQDVVQLLLPGTYRAGDRSPLRDADASILLSRWDGSPRALRESVYYSVPVLVSRETNFGELVATYGSGRVVADADDPSSVSDCLHDLATQRQLCRYRRGAAQLAGALSWTSTAEEFVCQYRDVSAEPVLHDIRDIRRTQRRRRSR